MDTKIKDIEISIIKYLRDFSTPFLDNLMQFITILGEQYVLIFGLAFIYFIYDKKIGQSIAYTIFTSTLVNNSIKGIVKYERPFVYDDSIDSKRVNTATGYSFPSGHTQNSSTFYSSVVLNCNCNKKNKKLLWAIVIILVTLIGFSRVYLGVHYPKDVIVGMLLGYGITFLCYFLLRKFKNKKKQLILYIVTLFIFTPFLFVFYKDTYENYPLYKDFYTSYALFGGFVLSYLIDTKFLNYSCKTLLSKRIIRFIGALIIFALIKFGLKFVFNLIVSENNIFLDFIRNFLLTFIVLGIYPLVFKNSLFKD